MTYKKEVIKKSVNLSTGIYHINVEHDDWCNIFKGKECNCKPNINKPKKAIK